MSEDRSVYTSVSLDSPCVEPKRAITVAGVWRRHQMKGFDFAEFPRQIKEMFDMLPALTGRIGDRVYEAYWGMLVDLGGYFDYLVGVEVRDDATLPAGYTTLVLPAQPYIIVANRLDDSPRDTAYTLWHEWMPTSESVHSGGDAPEFIYVHGEEYREDKRNGPLDIYVPCKNRTSS